jgi:phosphomannomutase
MRVKYAFCDGDLREVISPHDKEIHAAMLQNQTPWSDACWNAECVDTHALVACHHDAMWAAYWNALTAYRDTDSSTTTYFSFLGLMSSVSDSVKMIYTAMHGVGHPFAIKAMEVMHLAPFAVVEQQVLSVF